eukprot:TRINITY_DN5560_c0_g1_i4.p1 TRINITY_DN5560_c0_g1~~TRINITY_DN5560_c0_g1_i4.p1  ORF type:complete len:162 (-),score=7.87 TRINITY_DN5560_c0_g1_i4:24-470(-)
MTKQEKKRFKKTTDTNTREYVRKHYLHRRGALIAFLISNPNPFPEHRVEEITLELLHELQGKTITAMVDAIWKEVTPRCPHCGVAIYKDGGCRDMLCPICRNDFTWLYDEEDPAGNVNIGMQDRLHELRRRSAQQTLQEDSYTDDLSD